MMPPVPRLVRYGLKLSLKLLAFGLSVVMILVDEFADWISPELVKGKRLERSNLPNREPRP